MTLPLHHTGGDRLRAGSEAPARGGGRALPVLRTGEEKKMLLSPAGGALPRLTSGQEKKEHSHET